MGFLLALLGFLSPITTSLPLITFRAYWPLSQPNEFTNSFPGLSQAIYFLFTSYRSHKLTTSFLGLSRPLYSLFASFDSCGLADHQSCHFSLLGCFLILLLFFLSHFSYIVRLLLLLEWALTGVLFYFTSQTNVNMSSKTISMGMNYLVYIYLQPICPDMKKSIFLWALFLCKKKTPYVLDK